MTDALADALTAADNIQAAGMEYEDRAVRAALDELGRLRSAYAALVGRVSAHADGLTAVLAEARSGYQSPAGDVLWRLRTLGVDVEAMHERWRAHFADAVDVYRIERLGGQEPDDPVGASIWRHLMDAAAAVRATRFPAHDHLEDSDG